jgi:3-hydroxyisobutyrate dehydrogenase-like beta-hydroxyacid dehydrogenase
VVTAGFIGLGSQGGGMASRIADSEHELVLWARRPEALEPFAGRARVAASLEELGAACDVVGICVTDGAAVREVADAVVPSIRPDAVLAIHSTIGTGDLFAVHGARVIDAPVSGGGAAAAEGRLTVYVGGDDDAVAYARPVLETYGDPVLHMGALGAGQRTKLINNALAAAHFALAHDAFAVGESLGLDTDLLAEALRTGSGRSFSLDVFAMMRTFEPIKGMLGPIMRKDVGLFAREVPDDDVLLATADQFLPLLGVER